MSSINNWIGTPNQKWILCYRLSTHGSNTQTFHNNCDNRGPSVTIASLNKGRTNARIIGGYASLSWGGQNGQYRTTSNSFLFSLTNNFKHTLRSTPNGSSFYNNYTYGPTFGGGHDFTAGYGGNINQNQYCNLGNTYNCRIGSGTTCYNDFCGTRTPIISELEVYVQDTTNAPFFPNSKIINTSNMTTINNWVGSPKQRWILCYQKTTQGDQISTFHNHCDYRGPTITIAHLNKGQSNARIIGGYASMSWGGNTSWIRTSNSFLFSITNNFKHSLRSTPHSNSLYNRSNYGPTFGGGHDFTSGYSSYIGQNAYCNLGNTYTCRVGSGTTCYNDFCGTRNPIINELEVYMMDNSSGSLFLNSHLLSTPQMQQINNWNNTQNQRWHLCYRKSTHGASTSTFHRLCDYKGPTVFVASLATGRLIGGYANDSWGGSSRYFGNSTCFLFSLSNNFKHYHYRYNYYLYNNSSYGPTFGGGNDLRIYNNMNTVTSNLGHDYVCRVGSYGSSTCYNDFLGARNTTINEIEVFTKY